MKYITKTAPEGAAFLQLDLLAQDFVHPGSANGAFTLKGFSSVFHGHFFSFNHFGFLLAFHTICYFSHSFLLFIESEPSGKSLTFAIIA
jgi:hypothetical protein